MRAFEEPRDKKEHAEQEATGWHVLVPWECKLKKRLSMLADEIQESRQ